MRPRDIQQTRATFDYQWSHVPPGEWSLADPEFRAYVPEYICALTGLDRQWFSGKSVLDAGCGLGRHSFGLCRLGAQVTALDQSPAALRATRAACAAFPNFVGAIEADLLEPLPFDREFDLVWSYGVLHSTGDTHAAFRNVAARVKPGGYLLVMLYGEPRPGRIEDYHCAVSLEAWRCRCRAMSCDETVATLAPVVGATKLLQYFDEIAPMIRDRHGIEEVRGWFADEGFTDVRRLVDEMDLYVMARLGSAHACLNGERAPGSDLHRR